MKTVFLLSFLTVFGLTFAKPLVLDAVCPSPSLLSRNKKFCDYFVDNFMDFVSAEEYCTNLGGHLISFHDIFDDMDVTVKARKMLPNSQEYATGGNKLMNPGNWTWVDDGSLITGFTDWAPGEPVNSDTRNCLHVDLGRGQWYAADCYAKAPFVCRSPASLAPSTTTPAPTTAAPTTTTTTAAPPTTPTTTEPPTTAIMTTIVVTTPPTEAETSVSPTAGPTEEFTTPGPISGDSTTDCGCDQ